MKIALCQVNSIVGDIEGNLKHLENIVENINYRRADIFVFPELFVTGYPPRDLLDHSWFIEQSAYALDRLCDISRSLPEKLIIAGTVLPADEGRGHSLYNSAVAVENGSVVFSQHKTLLPTYDVFDEHRYFAQARKRRIFNYGNTRIGLTICEDMWNTEGSPLGGIYAQDPVAELAGQDADIIINISASPFHLSKSQDRRKMIQNHVAAHGRPFLMVNAVGANDELIFDGGSIFADAGGEIRCELPRFTQTLQIIDTEGEDSSVKAPQLTRREELHGAVVLGIRDYFSKCGFSSAVIGLSGGIDSAVTAALAAAALGAENVIGVTMPSQHSSGGSVTDSEELAKNLGIRLEQLPIRDIYSSVVTGLDPFFRDTPPNIAEENIQARIRGLLLMAVANKYGTLVLNTGNKSEMAVGYCTLYGDMNGALSVLGDVYKGDVYNLAEYINRTEEIIPVDTIRKAPSAELRPDQKDEDSLPPYDELDRILRALLEEDRSGDDLIEAGADGETIRWIIAAIKRNEYKRRQAPPVLKVTPKAFGMGRRFPIASRYEW
ncbi:MAG: NAD+ synthase [Fibrobacterota bacterium]